MTKNKRPCGWYWVKPAEHRKWRPDYWRDGKWRAIWSSPEDDDVHFAIGDRILAPDEMEGWQMVPKELDIAMVEEFEDRLTEQGWSSDAAGEIDKQDLWDAQLAVAPMAEDV